MKRTRLICVAVLLAFCGCAELQGALTQAPRSGRGLRWVGKGTDLVGSWTNAHPDGQPDGIFQLSVSVPPDTAITSIAVSSCDAQGRKVGGQIWHSAQAQFWVLGVVHGGRQLNFSHVPTLGTFTGLVNFELHCADSGFFNRGQRFLAEVTLANGSVLTSTVQL